MFTVQTSTTYEKARTLVCDCLNHGAQYSVRLVNDCVAQVCDDIAETGAHIGTKDRTALVDMLARHFNYLREAETEYNRDLALRARNGQVGSGMKFRG